MNDDLFTFLQSINNDGFTPSDIAKYNQIMRECPEKEKSDPENDLFKKLKEIGEEDVPKIYKESYSWKITKAREYKIFFNKLMNLQGVLYYEFANNDYLRKKLKVEYFHIYAQVDYGRVGGSATYDEVIRCFTNMLTFFNHSVLMKDFAFLPRLEAQNCFLFDPIFRQKVREINRSNPDIEKIYFQSKFNIKKFIFLCIEKFFPNVGWRWTGGGHEAHVQTLIMVNILFEYGIWEIKDINKLLTQLYAISEVMFNLENFMHDDRNKVHQKTYFDKQIVACTRCRELVASSFIHIILMYLDEDVNDKFLKFDYDIDYSNSDQYKAFGLNKNKLTLLFKYSTFNKEKLYTYFSYILVTYLSRYKHIKDGFQPIGSPELSKLLNILYTYISDINGDFFKISMKMMREDYFQFYLLKKENSYQKTALELIGDFSKLLHNIREGNYGNIESGFTELCKDLEKGLNNTHKFLKTKGDDSNSEREFTTKKLVLTLYNIPQYVLSFLRYMVELDGEPKITTTIMHNGLSVLRKMCTENTPGFNQIFSGYNYQHFDYLIKQRVNEMNLLIRQLILNNGKILMIEYYPNVMLTSLNRYTEILKAFMDNYTKTNDKWDLDGINAKYALTIYNYNKIFNTLLEAASTKRFRYDLYIAEILLKSVPIILSELEKEEINNGSYESYNFWSQLLTKKDEFIVQIKNWDNLGIHLKRIMMFELFRSLLELFNRSTNRYYTSATLNVVTQCLNKDFPINKFMKFFDIEIGISVFNQIIRLYGNFMIFRQNHLINNRFDEFGNIETQTTENTLSEYLIEGEMVDELLNVKRASLQYIERFGFNRRAVNFYLCSFFPLLFKYYNGLLTVFIYEDHKSCKKSFEMAMKKIEHYRLFIRDLAKRFPKNQGGHEAFNEKYKNLDKIDEQIDKYTEMFENESSAHLYDEAPGTTLYTLRKQGYKFLKEILYFYKYQKRKKMHLEKYIRYDPCNSHRTISNIMTKKLRFNYLYRKTQNLPAEEAYNKYELIKAKHPRDVIKAITKSYEYSKTFFFEYPENNQCFKVLKTADILKNNLEYYIAYFFKEMSQMDINFEVLDKNIFTNPNYISLILMMDNLIKISDGYRDTFYSYIEQADPTKPEGQEVINVVSKIWHLHKALYYFVMYKTFFDRDWAEVYTIYYLISNFIQNLCEDNCVKFKLWFHTNNKLSDDGKSLFISYYNLFEAAFQNNKLHKNTSPNLILSDKPEMFNVLNRLIVGMTEFINGGAVKTQFEIYKYKVDIWVGIVLRIIDDVDSQFYQLKENILSYLLGLTEGYDKNIINFMATNFPITRLYDLIYRLTKKLFVRQYFMKEGLKQEREPSLLGYYTYKITEDDESSNRIKNTECLLDYYKRYDCSFNDHIILAVIIKTYTLMRDLSTHVVRYENFLIEKREDIEQYIIRKKTTDGDLEPLYVWNFLKNIIIDIEIVYKDINTDANKQIPLQNFYFKKLPQCFFLTKHAKKEFRDRVKINSLDEKHEQFFNAIDQFDIATKDLKDLYKGSKTLFALSTERSFYIAQFVLYLIALIINICLLFFYNAKEATFKNSRGNLNLLRIILSIASASLAFTFGIFWFLFKYPTLRKINWEKYSAVHHKDNTITWYDYFKINVYESVIKVGSIQSFTLHFIFSLLGLFVSAFFYTVLLLLIIHLSLLVYNVVLSFMNNYDKLFFTLILILVVINSFSYLTTQFYRGDFRDEDIGPDFENVCDTYFSCLMNSFNMGIRGGGGLSEYMEFNAQGESAPYLGRLFFDVFFFIMINIILLGIFFGIIVDSFKELRDAMTKRNRDEEDVCFTCGLERYDLERKGIDFDEHIKVHDIWNYFFYIIYLRSKPENDYDGVDIYVNRLLTKDFNTAWLPIGRTLKLEQND